MEDLQGLIMNGKLAMTDTENPKGDNQKNNIIACHTTTRQLCYEVSPKVGQYVTLDPHRAEGHEAKQSNLKGEREGEGGREESMGPAPVND